MGNRWPPAATSDPGNRYLGVDLGSLKSKRHNEESHSEDGEARRQGAEKNRRLQSMPRTTRSIR